MAERPEHAGWEGQEWPFSSADLTAGLRRSLGDHSIQIVHIAPLTLAQRRPAIGKISGLTLTYKGRESSGDLRLVVKEPLGTTRTGLAGAGRREVGFYSSLAVQVPIKTPAMLAASDSGDWLVLEYLDQIREPNRWATRDYETAIDALAGLHDRFWGLTEDLSAFFWLSDSVGADFDVHVAAARKAIRQLVKEGKPEPLAGSPERIALLTRLVDEADQVVEPLRREPGTLLHGDYWPGNIAVLDGDDQAVYDWQLAGVGPVVLDLLVFVNKSDWWFGLQQDERERLVRRYRERLQQLGGVTWREDAWERLWDHALMWRFIQEWLDLLAATPPSLLTTRADQLDSIWLVPLRRAVDRRLGVHE